MNVIERIEHWGDAHHPRWLDLLRIALGVIIFLKGATFLSDTESLRHLIEQTPIKFIRGGPFITLHLHIWLAEY